MASIPNVMSALSSRIDKFVFDPDTEMCFTKWYLRYKDVFVEDAKQLTENARVRLLCEKLDCETFERYQRHVLPKEVTSIGFEETVDTLKQLFDVKTSEFTMRYQCLKLEKRDAEDYLVYTGRVNEFCERAKIHELDSDRIKCLLWIFGLKSQKEAEIRQRLIAVLDREYKAGRKMPLQELYKECENFLSLKKDSETIAGNVKTVEAAIKQERQKRECWNCCGDHFARQCKCKPWFCKKCRKTGHKEKFCDVANQRKTAGNETKGRRSRQSNDNNSNRENKKTIRSSRKRVRGVKIANATGEVNSTRMYVKVKVNQHPVDFLLDTGSDITLLNENVWKSMGAPKLENTNVVKNENMSYHMQMMVAEVKADQNGGAAMRLKKTYSRVFEKALGLCTKEKANLQLMGDVRPVFKACRPVPHAAVEAVERELDRLLEMGVITPVTHSEWAAPIVCVRKSNGKSRVCADFSTGLNRALESFDYPFPVPEDIFATLNGEAVFSQIDLSDAYLQIELSDESKKMVVISKHRGLFQYNRLPFGIKTAPGIFQQIMNKMVAGLRGVATYLDDILVCGKTEQEYMENLLALFERISEYGFKIRIEKCSFAKPEIRYLGFILDRTGRRPNPEKIEAIKSMTEPKSVGQLRAFLGMNRHETLSVVGGCLMFGERVVIPPELQSKVLKELHFGHPGIVRMKRLARSYVYWPNIDSDCENMVRSYTNCQKAAKNPIKVPLKAWPSPTRVWQRVHVDFAGPLQGVYYLVVVDAFSKWPEMIETSNISATKTVRVLGSLFERYGLPQTITYRTTPNLSLDEKTPAEVFLGRKIRTRLSLLVPQPESVEDPLSETRRERMEEQFNRKHGVLEKQFEAGDPVDAKQWKAPHFHWVKGIVRKRIGSVNYEVEIDGKLIRKHANQLRRRDLEGDHSKEKDTVNVLLDVLSGDDYKRRENVEPEPNPDSTIPDARLPCPTSAMQSTQIQLPTTLRRSTRIRRPVQRYDSSCA
ncbi:reverse transcriptase [Ancylostoma duodenale]|uniref:RNA-directed DNA polymerase n=1 Tax=Ancylostoma duodenale TaxID=51022 RepID=A0A0C2CLK8_9BILA|nr:reverse transcriptase [Ancylostoma duodenale]